jgi:hypothetical protein
VSLNKNFDLKRRLANMLASSWTFFDNLLQLIGRRKWRWLRAAPNSGGFITCDHPVRLFRKKKLSGRAPIGFGLKNTTVLFPISPIVALEGEFEGSTEMVEPFTGMRRGEVLALRWSDFNSTAKTLRIERALEYTQRHGLLFKAPKSERGKRTIVLDDFLVDLLAKHRDKYLRIASGSVAADNVDRSFVKLPTDWLIFHAPGGQFHTPRHPDSVTKQFVKRAEKILGFSIRLHTHGTWLLDQGEPVHVVAKRLGHDPSVLLRVYAKRTQKGDEDAASTIGAMTSRIALGPT